MLRQGFKVPAIALQGMNARSTLSAQILEKRGNVIQTNRFLSYGQSLPQKKQFLARFAPGVYIGGPLDLLYPYFLSG